MIEVLLLLPVLLHHCHLSTLLLLSNLLRQTPLFLKVLVDIFYAAQLLLVCIVALLLVVLLLQDGGVVMIAAKLTAFLRCLMRRLLLDMDRSWQDLRLLNRAMLFSHRLLLTVRSQSKLVRELEADLFVDGRLAATQARLVQVLR